MSDMLPFTAASLKERLDVLLVAVLSSRRTTFEPANQLSRLDRHNQDFVLRWVEVISKSNSEMAYQFVSHAPRAFELMDLNGVENWIIEAMDVYDRQGLYPGSASFQKVEIFAENLIQQEHAVSFDEVAGILQKFIMGVSGRRLEVHCDASTWTDTKAIYLPEAVNLFNSKKLNFQLIKAMGAYMQAQNRYGTFRMDEQSGTPIICESLKKYSDQDKALSLFEAVEEIRIFNRIQKEMPGLARQLNDLKLLSGNSNDLDRYLEVAHSVCGDDCDVTSTLEAVEKLYQRNVSVRQRVCYQGTIDLESVRLTAGARVEKEKKSFRNELALLSEGVVKDGQPESPETKDERGIQIELSASSSSENFDFNEFMLTIDGQPVTPTDDMVQTAQSIIQDFGTIPDDCLVPAADESQHCTQSNDEMFKQELQTHADEVFVYDEWDYRRGHYRKSWCALTEMDTPSSDVAIINDILEKHCHLVREIRKSFEALRDNSRLLRRQKSGDDIDIDAVVDGYVDVVEGNEMSDRLFIKSRKLERDLAVVFMVDVSGSTKGWINDAERESLVLLCEALRILGDRYAIYGFSGMTRKRCEVYRIKTFDEPYSSEVKSRIAGLRPKDYTRMGVTIRHLSRKLIEIDAKTRLLITISDGKPDDYDGYRGEYGVEDTRQALMEAKHSGIYPFCITIDSHAHDYLPRMYGHVNYTVIDDIRRLPLQVSDIYRNITT